MPTNRAVYCTDAAIKTHVQNIKLPTGVTWDSLAETASNEVDSNLGVRYVTPIQVSANDPTQKAAAYWLQNVTSMVAAGRLMLSIAAPGSQDTANSYGQYLLRNAQQLMNDVISGKVDLPGAEEVPANGSTIQGPTVLNQDAFSQVDLFYDNFMPEGIVPGRTVRPGGTPWPR
ncbi:head-to-tail adaptor [Gordonia phage Lidong]|uniref:Head-to-tail adaptor n=2 Tax=Woesvirus woes TaxID=1982751 RepID=A0A2P1N5E7_9CAUD|nr:head-to-tail adaptor [Gordonia phage Hail2Pitt]QAX94302.1 head-to-tail adaptor [Gordonia phage Guillaume]UVK62746.1 head-to-tail adaptor [Gordonia phage Lidong]WAA19551.1 head-to-tail adaptor [Gordonia phage GalacticEye]